MRLQAAHDAELRRVLMRLAAALGRHVGGLGGIAAAAAADADLRADGTSSAAADAELGLGSSGSCGSGTPTLGTDLPMTSLLLRNDDSGSLQLLVWVRR